MSVDRALRRGTERGGAPLPPLQKLSLENPGTDWPVESKDARKNYLHSLLGNDSGHRLHFTEDDPRSRQGSVFRVKKHLSNMLIYQFLPLLAM